MTEILDKLEEELKFFDEVGAVREDDEYDNVELSDKEDDDNDNNVEENEQEESNGDDDDDEGEDVGSGESSSQPNENNKRQMEDGEDGEEEEGEDGKKRKVEPVRRKVDGDNISLCFIPIGTLDKDPLCLLGVTLACVRVVSEYSFLQTLKRNHRPEAPMTDAEKKFEKKYDFFENQSLPEAPTPKHFCQLSKAEHFLYTLKANWREVSSATIKSMQEGARKPKRCFIYCVAKFDTAEQMLANSCPFLCYPMKGKLTWSSPFSTNWQSATEWPSESLDVQNAPLNAALVTEAKLFRSILDGGTKPSCCSNQPLGSNALFQFNFEGLCKFGQTAGNLPVRHQLKFNQGKRVSAHKNFDNGSLTLKTSVVTWTFSRSNFLAIYDESLPHQHGRSGDDEHTTMATVCQEQFSKDKQVAAVLTRNLQKNQIAKKLKSLMLFRNDPQNMSFKDAIALLRQTSESSERFKQLVAWIIPATAPSYFWQSADFVGFRNAIRMALADVLEGFRKFMNSQCPQIVLDSSRFVPFKLCECPKFCTFLSLQTGVTVEDVKLYSHLSNIVRSSIEMFLTEQRFLSRPDATENTRKLCWPNDPNSTVGALEVELQRGEKTTFVTRKYLLQQDILIATALAFGFQKKVRLCRSDNRHTLRALLEDQVIDGSFCAIVVNSASDKVYWEEKAKGLATLKIFMYTGKPTEFGKLLRTQLTSLPNEEKWHLAIPRVDMFSYDVLTTILSFVTTTLEINESFPNRMSYIALRPSDTVEITYTKNVYSKGCCSGGALIIGGLPFQFAVNQTKCGSLVDDLYFSGLVDGSTSESYNVVQKYQDEALSFITSGEKMVTKSFDQTCRLSSRFISFSKHFLPEYTVTGFETIEILNNAMRNNKVLTLFPNTTSGEVNTLAKQKIDQSRSETLPLLIDHQANSGCVAVVFDSVDDNMFFSFNKDKKNISLLSYDYAGVDKQPNTELVDRILEFHGKVKRYVRSGFSLAAMVSIAQSDPKSIVVFGSKHKSIDARVSGYCEAPWFLTPPSKTQVGRPWYQNSEATELSALCWILSKMWNKVM